MALAPGSRLGVYEIVAALGAGGMGEVYRARDTRLGRDVALKTIHADLSRDADRLARFEREARAVAALNHPNIVTLFALDEAEGTRFLVMELVEGRGLDAAIVAGGLPVAKALDLTIALCEALTAAHARGIVHRDLKPGNLMLTRDERLKVLDFGLARMDAGTSDVNATQAATVAAPLSAVGQVMGTAPYMSPEQVRGEATDPRTDLFATGIILYELLTGVRPFGGATSADIASAILRDTPPTLLSHRASLPGELEDIVARCLAKDRAQRFESAAELRQALVRVRQALANPQAQRAPKPEQETPSIAVLPFANRSADPEDEYFSDGLADELLSLLAKIRGLRVAARTSSMAFKGKAVAVSEIGAALRVASVLEGTVRKSGSRVRISVQLVKVDDGFHLWSETFDRTLDDIFAVQDDIAQAVVKELRTTLLGETADTNASGDARAEVARAAKGRAVDAESHRLFLQARYFAEQGSDKGFERAVALYREALARDPNSSRCWSGLASVLWSRAAHGHGEFADGARAAREALDRAFALDPDEPDAHAALGDLLFGVDWDWEASRRAFERALEVDPSNISALVGIATLESCLCEHDAARKHTERLIDVDPLNPRGHTMMGRIHRSTRRPEEAIADLRRAIEISPDVVVARSAMSLCLLELGRPEEALAMAGQERAEWSRLTAESPILFKLGRIAESDAAIAGLVAMGDATSSQIACCYGWRGDADGVMKWLERSIAARDPGCAFVKSDPAFRTIQGDPRWKDFLRRMNMLD